MRGTTTQFVLAVLCLGGGVLTGCELVADVDNTLIPGGGAGGGGGAEGGSGGSGAAGAEGGSGGAGAQGADGGTGGMPGGAGGAGGAGGCENGTLDGEETDVDCGGTECGACGNGFVCEGVSDCTSLFCDAGAGGSGPKCAACVDNTDCVDAEPAWNCSAGVCTNTGAKPNGEPCSIDGDCVSTHCVDGLCCDTACGGDVVDDCVACSVAAGTLTDGTCGPLASATPCGDASSSECDAADSCDGAGNCDENLVADGTPCTDDMVFCNGVEACDGAGACTSPGDPCAAPLTCDESGAICFENVWVNEIHYDNTGVDVGESLEVAGVAGIDLTGWGVIFYDGATGSAYAGFGFAPGAIPDQDNGFGTVSMLTPGIQEDAPEGFALMDGSFNVVQFLSTEGSFTATDGPAMGMTSVDIGVLEDDTTAVGESLQLTGGPGAAYEDFTWASPAASTFGSVNTGQSF